MRVLSCARCDKFYSQRDVRGGPSDALDHTGLYEDHKVVGACATYSRTEHRHCADDAVRYARKKLNSYRFLRRPWIQAVNSYFYRAAASVLINCTELRRLATIDLASIVGYCILHFIGYCTKIPCDCILIGA